MNNKLGGDFINNYEVKVVPKFNLNPEDNAYIWKVIKEISKECDMVVENDEITYSKRKPHRELEDIPAGFKFYNKMRKYKDYLTALEYYSYLEGDINGRIIRSNN